MKKSKVPSLILVFLGLPGLLRATTPGNAVSGNSLPKNGVSSNGVPENGLPSNGQEQPVSQAGSAATTNGFPSPIKSKFDASADNTGNAALPQDQINLSHQIIQNQIQAGKVSGSANPGPVHPGTKVGANPGPIPKAGRNPGPTGTTAKLDAGKIGLSHPKGFQKAAGLSKLTVGGAKTGKDPGPGQKMPGAAGGAAQTGPGGGPR